MYWLDNMRITIPAPPLPPIRINVRRPLLIQNVGTTTIYISENETALIGSVDLTGTPQEGSVLLSGNFLPEISADSPPLYALALSPGGEINVTEKALPSIVYPAEPQPHRGLFDFLKPRPKWETIA